MTTTPERVEQMIEAQKEMTDGRGSNMFLFIDDASLLSSNPLDALGRRGRGGRSNYGVIQTLTALWPRESPENHDLVLSSSISCTIT